MRRERAIAGRNIIVQVIHVSWDKSGRGGKAAEHRNRVPLALPLPPGLTPQADRHLLIHESHWGHTNSFASELSSKIRAMDADAGFRYRCASVRATAEGAELDWKWNESGGIPPRTVWDEGGHRVPLHHTIAIAENGWGRVRWNGRFTCVDTGTWWYEAVTTNVCVYSETEIPADLFTRSEPAAECDLMEHLR